MTLDHSEITKLREQVAAQAAVIENMKCESRDACIGLNDYFGQKLQAQAAVIEKLREALIAGWSLQCDFDDARQLADEALALSTDSTQILDEVRRAEREKVIERCIELGAIERDGVFAEEIRAME